MSVEQLPLILESTRSTALAAWYRSEDGKRFDTEFCKRALALDAANKHISAKLIIEEMRRDGWTMNLGKGSVGINNTLVTPFVELFANAHPELEHKFERRSRRPH